MTICLCIATLNIIIDLANTSMIDILVIFTIVYATNILLVTFLGKIFWHALGLTQSLKCVVFNVFNKSY